ncbi:MAG: LacI family transcriptional regulator [Lachnospiraceae bacterium]|nr:LacI family transcriptional regulator [Lachnospiraceae bacterium]
MNIYDISRLAGVSTATVSRVINGTDNVKQSTRDRVLNVMEQFGYTPNAFARGLGLNTMNSIGIMCADSSDIYLSKAVYYIEGQLRKNGYHCILTCTGYEREQQKKSLSMLLAQHVDCIILVGSVFIDKDEANNDHIYNAANSVPVMLLNATLEHDNIYCVMCDDQLATQDATISLIEKDIKNILYLYNTQTFSALRKAAGYRRAFETKGLICDERYLQFYKGSSQDIDGIFDFLIRLSNKGLVFDSVVASDDFLAIGAVKYALRQGLKIPDDFSVIGYNNSVITACCEPELTSVDNHLELLCNTLVKVCMTTLSGEATPNKTIFHGTLVHRSTTKTA